MSEAGEGILAALADVDACAVSDALDALGLPGVALGLGRLSTRRRIHGRVITVQLGDRQGSAPPSRHLGTSAVEAATEGDVIVIANDGRSDVAGWGGTLAAGAVMARVSGVVVDGAIRDSDECEALGLPVFARTSVPVTARGRIVERSWNQPITVCGVRVSPGDYVVADGSGVVFIPADAAAEVVAQASRIAAHEQHMAAQLGRGSPISAVMGASYETLLEGTS
jgi:4-hydroxy-4-methyl-2-oxoglutarate aldolase